MAACRNGQLVVRYIKDLPSKYTNLIEPKSSLLEELVRRVEQQVSKAARQHGAEGFHAFLQASLKVGAQNCDRRRGGASARLVGSTGLLCHVDRKAFIGIMRATNALTCQVGQHALGQHACMRAFEERLQDCTKVLAEICKCTAPTPVWISTTTMQAIANQQYKSVLLSAKLDSTDWKNVANRVLNKQQATGKWPITV